MDSTSSRLLRPRKLIFVVEIMPTIDELYNDVLQLEQKSNPWEEKLLALVQQSNEHLNAEQKRELTNEIKIVRNTISEYNRNISEKNQMIIAKERQIATHKETNLAKERQITAQIEEQEKRNTSDNQLQNNLELLRNQGKSSG